MHKTGFCLLYLKQWPSNLAVLQPLAGSIYPVHDMCLRYVITSVQTLGVTDGVIKPLTLGTWRD